MATRRDKRMSDTYARVMKPSDGSGDGKAMRSAAASDPGRVPGTRRETQGAPKATRGSQARGSQARGPQEHGPRAADSQVPESEAVFAAVAAAFLAGREVQVQRDFVFEDVPAPKRLAPYATAIAAAVRRDDADVAWGRLVLLYDPDGQEGWGGAFRLVAYIRAEVDPEMAADPLLGQVGWSWLSEALDAHVPGYAVPSGTVTRVITEGFGGKQDEVPLTGFELRASWSPVGPAGPGRVKGAKGGEGAAKGRKGRGSGASTGDLDALDLQAHIAAWCDCLSAAAGLEPPGTRALRQPGYG
jgi:hypothetical protein